MIVFDLDGTLADTRDAVIEAYRIAGVEYPADAWGKPWHSWLPSLVGVRQAEQIHKAKCEVYPRLMHMVRALPPASVARILQAEGHEVQVLTGASRAAAVAVLDHLRLPLPIMRASVSLAGKRYDLEHNGRGVLIDDQPVPVPPGWAMIRYVPGTDEAALLEAIRWTQSS